MRWSEASLRVSCVHGDVHESLSPFGLMPIALATKLPYTEVLGQVVPMLFDLLPHPKACNRVITRAQSSMELSGSYHFMAWS